MHKNVNEHAELGDIKWLRYFFRDSLDIDPTFEEYEEDYECAREVSGMIVPYQELTPLTDDQSRWDIDYWIKLKRDLMENFSVKRLEHMKKVARVIHADKLVRKQEALEREKLLREIKESKQRVAEQKAVDDSEDIEVKTRKQEALEREKLLREIKESKQRTPEQKNNIGFTNDCGSNYQQTKSGEAWGSGASSKTSEGSDIDAKKIVGIAVTVVIVGAVIILLVK